MGRRYDTISFLTDYGTTDEFVGVVKSVVRGIAPHAVVIDITHEIPPHDTRTGALTLMRSAQYLASGVILAVVDPGVGTARRAVAVEVAGGEGIFVGPDNGLLAPAVAMTGGAERAVELTNAEYHLPAPGPTFAGRDVFGPVAGHLCNGVDLAELGTEIDPLSLLPGIIPLSATEDDHVRGEVLWVDRFGNVQLNIDPDEIERFGDRLVVKWNESDVRRAKRAATYGDLKPGQLGIVVDSYGLVSLALERGSAATELRLRPGDSVILTEPS
jgi:S-adenosyl-L-methionine hydrolase (adenosine-forming)